MQHEMWKQLCISLSMAVGNVNIVEMGIATRVVEGVVDACCLSRCICCFQCRLCLLVEQSIVNGSCRNRQHELCLLVVAVQWQLAKLNNRGNGSCRFGDWT